MACASSIAEHRELECTICSDVFTNPKALNCLHTFCESCLQSWILRLSEECDGTLGGIECPLCRKTTLPPVANTSSTEWAGNLPNNFALLPILESMERGNTGKTEYKQEGCCDPCLSDGDEKRALSYCMECKERLCGDCCEVHKKLSIAKGHTVTNLKGQHADRLSHLIQYRNYLMCDAHTAKKIEFYCYDDDDVVCTTCAFVKHRGCDKIVEISKDENIKYSDTTPTIMKKHMERLKDHLARIVGIRQEYKHMIDSDVKELPVKLKETRQKIITRFDQFNEKALKNGKDLHAKLSNDNESRLEECGNLIASLETFIDNAKHVTVKCPASEYFIVCRALKKHLENVKCDVEKTCEGSFAAIQFEQNKDFFTLLETDAVFGSVKQLTKAMRIPHLPEIKPLMECKIHLTYNFQSKISGRYQPRLTSCAYMIDDKLMLADMANKRLLMVEDEATQPVETKYRQQPWAVKLLDNAEKVAVTYPSQKKVIIYEANAEFKRITELNTEKACYAVDVLGDGCLVVTLLQNDKWSLVVIDKSGKKISTLTSDSHGREFKSFWHVMESMRIVYQPCQDESALFAFKLDDASPVFEYRHKKLQCPGGLDMDVDDNIYVCGTLSHNVHMVSNGGNCMKIIKIPECQFPTDISFSFNGEDFAILGNSENPGPFLFRFEI